MRDLVFRLVTTVIAILALALLQSLFGFASAVLSGLGIIIGILLAPLPEVER